MANKTYKLQIIETFEFPTQEDADAFADFKYSAECETPECVKVEVVKEYEK